MVLDSVSTVVRKGYVARFPTVWAVIEAIRAKPYFVLTLANRTVLFASTLLLGFVADGADDGTGHGEPP